MNTSHPCYKPEELAIMHWPTVKTGRKGINPISGKEYTIYRCPCGKKETEVYSK